MQKNSKDASSASVQLGARLRKNANTNHCKGNDWPTRVSRTTLEHAVRHRVLCKVSSKHLYKLWLCARHTASSATECNSGQLVQTLRATPPSGSQHPLSRPPHPLTPDGALTCCEHATHHFKNAVDACNANGPAASTRHARRRSTTMLEKKRDASI